MSLCIWSLSLAPCELSTHGLKDLLLALLLEGQLCLPGEKSCIHSVSWGLCTLFYVCGLSVGLPPGFCGGCGITVCALPDSLHAPEVSTTFFQPCTLCCSPAPCPPLHKCRCFSLPGDMSSIYPNEAPVYAGVQCPRPSHVPLCSPSIKIQPVGDTLRKQQVGIPVGGGTQFSHTAFSRGSASPFIYDREL